MRFAEGEILVHPHHGPATVHAVTTRALRGVDCAYLLLRIHDSNLMVGVPVEQIEQVGLRPVLDGERLHELLAVLQAPTGFEERQWSRRIKANHEKLSSGDLRQVAEVTRDLIHRRDRAGLSGSETTMLKDAQHLLSAELALALELDPAGAVEHLEALCRSGDPASPHPLGAPEKRLQPAG